MHSGNHFLDNQVRERIFVQIVAIPFYRLNGLMLAGVIPETPPCAELISFFVKTGDEVHIILLSDGIRHMIPKTAASHRDRRKITTEIRQAGITL